jgi:sec-independent protein translocase protein TatC
MTQPREDEPELPSQPIVEHLIELRNRLIYAILSVIVLLIPLSFFTNTIYDFIASPLIALLPVNGDSSMIVTDLPAAFLTPFKLTFFASLFLAMPFILYQMWAFIAPALYRHERALAVPILLSSIVLFYLGVGFAYYLVFPMIFKFFTAVAPSFVTVMPDITAHLNLVLKLFFAFGVVFEIPVATVILIVAGIISPQAIVEKRPYIIIGCFVVGMVLTPPDVFSQTMLAVPMWMLFEVGVFFGRLAIKNREQEAN